MSYRPRRNRRSALRLALGAVALALPPLAAAQPALGPPPRLGTAPPVVVDGPPLLSGVVDRPKKEWDAGFKLAWAVKLPPSTSVEVMTILPTGDLLVATWSWLGVLARHSGEVLESAETCSARPAALAVYGPNEVLVVCDDQLLSVRVPGLSSRRIAELPSLDVATLALPLLATADEGLVRIIDTRSGAVTREIAEPEEVTALRLSPDGVWLAVVRKGVGTVLHSVSGDTRRWISAGSALDFSPASDALLVDLGRPRVYALSGGLATTDLVAHRGLSLRRARYLSPGRLVAQSFHHGLVFVNLDTLQADATSGRTEPNDHGLTSAPDGRQVCVFGAFGTVACHAARPLAPSVYRASSKPPPTHRTEPVTP